MIKWLVPLLVLGVTPLSAQVGLSARGQGPGQAGPVLEEVKAHGSRNIWVPLDDGSNIPRLAEHGFNSATAATGLLAGATSSAAPDDSFIIRESDVPTGKLELVRAMARQCHEHRILFLPYFNQLAGAEVMTLYGKHYRRVVNERGREGWIAPCPLERKDWFGFQLPQILSLVRVLQEEGCEGGVMLEGETYCASDLYPGYHTQRQELCFCDHCFDLFLDKLPPQQRPADPLKAKERYPWLSAQGLLWNYQSHMRQELVKLLRELAADVRKVKPDCVFGMYPYAIHWYSDAVVEGLGTPELPFLVYSASEYYTGFNQRNNLTWSSNYSSADHVQHLRRLGIPHLYLGGLSVGTYWPQRMGLEMARLAREGGGFWLYWGGTLLVADGQIGIAPEGGSEYVLREQPSLYWPQLKRANQALLAGQAHPAQPEQAVQVWQKLEFRGPDAPFQTWDANNPPTRRGGWEANGLLPGIQNGCLLFDPGAVTRRPKALALDYKFQQPADTAYLFGVEVRYDGEAMGARINLGYSSPGNTEAESFRGGKQADKELGLVYSYPRYPWTDGRQVFWYLNEVIYPEEGWVTLWLQVPAPQAEQTSWVRLLVHPCPGKVSVERIVLAPSQPYELESQKLELAAGARWGKVAWHLDGEENCVFSVDVLEAETERQLYQALPNGFDLGDLTSIYGIKAITLKASCLVPAGQKARLRWLKVGSGPSASG